MADTFSAPCFNGHDDWHPDCRYCDDRAEIAAEIAELVKLCPKHPHGCDMDCGACGERQDAAGRSLLRRVEAATARLGV